MMNYSIFVIDDEYVAREGVTMALKSDYEEIGRASCRERV